MGLFRKQTATPPPVPPIPPAATPPTAADATMAVFANKSRARRGSGMGFAGTIKTTPQGVPEAGVARTSLLGGN